MKQINVYTVEPERTAVTRMPSLVGGRQYLINAPGKEVHNHSCIFLRFMQAGEIAYVKLLSGGWSGVSPHSLVEMDSLRAVTNGR